MAGSLRKSPGLRSTPPAFWREYPGTRVLLVGGNLTVILYWVTVIILLQALPNWMRSAPYALKIGSGLGTMLVIYGTARLWRRNQRRYGRYVEERQFQVCIQCGYDLRQLPPQHACPECGTPYRKGEIEQFWRFWLRRD